MPAFAGMTRFFGYSSRQAHHYLVRVGIQVAADEWQRGQIHVDGERADGRQQAEDQRVAQEMRISTGVGAGHGKTAFELQKGSDARELGR